jgi:hypothetical protein
VPDFSPSVRVLCSSPSLPASPLPNSYASAAMQSKRGSDSAAALTVNRTHLYLHFQDITLGTALLLEGPTRHTPHASDVGVTYLSALG